MPQGLDSIVDSSRKRAQLSIETTADLLPYEAFAFYPRHEIPRRRPAHARIPAALNRSLVHAFRYSD